MLPLRTGQRVEEVWYLPAAGQGKVVRRVGLSGGRKGQTSFGGQKNDYECNRLVDLGMRGGKRRR
jgi:hypothetical protein